MAEEYYTPRKMILLCIGFIAIALAAIGVLMPVLPAVPFLVVALWAFARSDERMHQWLVKIPLFRSVMKHAIYFEKHRAVTRGVKILAQLGSWSSFLFLLTLKVNIIVIIVAFICALLCSILMWIVPTMNTQHELRESS